MELISMTDFVIYQYEKLKNKEINTLDYAFNTGIYAHFLKKPLKLGYFIPCDENDLPLEEPKLGKSYYGGLNENEVEWDYDEFEYNRYQEAKQRVLFEGFKTNLPEADTIGNIVCISNNNFQITFFKVGDTFLDDLETNKTTIISNIEDLIGLYLKLTETAKKEIGL